MAVEDPGDSPVISARYGRHRMSRINATDFLPFFGTDIGNLFFKFYMSVTNIIRIIIYLKKHVIELKKY